MTKTSFMSQLNKINETIKTIQNKSKLAEKNIKIIAVSKRQSVEKIKEALKQKHFCFGENRIQEAYEKWPLLKETYPNIELHLIGPLQTNKVKQALSLFDVIETLDRVNLAEKLKKEMEETNIQIPCYVQINTGDEPQKSGVLTGEAHDFISFCIHDLLLPIEGVMCIPPQDDDPSIHFAYLRKVAKAHNLEKISMGMSNDYEKAVFFGATHIRIGTSLFGERSL